MRGWRDPQGDALTLAVKHGPFLIADADTEDLQVWCRNIARGNSAGLIECRADKSPLGKTVCLIYKWLNMPGYAFTGMLFISDPNVSLVWTAVAREIGSTGIRDAVVTAELLNAGELTIESYESSWAADPYDGSFNGVGRSVLRFMSDDERYDSRFPDHPLSKVRRVLRSLPKSITTQPMRADA
jgi:hypothetical protein